LRTLFLGYNQITSIDPKLFEVLSELRELFLGGNNIKILPREIGLLQELTDLSIGNNDISELPAEISKAHSLAVLSAWGNTLKHIPVTIVELTNLRSVDLTGNELSKLPAEAEKLTSLLELSLAANRIELDDQQVENMKQLKRVTLDGNKLLDTQYGEFSNLQLVKQSLRFTIGYADMTGRRPSMEDAILIYGGYRNKFDQDYVAIFDGNGGSQASAYAASTHYKLLQANLDNSNTDIMDAIVSSIKKTNDIMENEFPRSFYEGTTALISFFIENKLYSANLGDSRTILCRDGKAIRVSKDHKPGLLEEEQRIRELGGHVQDGRVNGKLAVSRALGDFHMRPYVISDPYTNIIELTDKDEYLIMACDGLWDMISDQQACDICMREKAATRASAVLRDFSYMIGSDDNISVVVVKLKQEGSKRGTQITPEQPQTTETVQNTKISTEKSVEIPIEPKVEQVVPEQEKTTLTSEDKISQETI